MDKLKKWLALDNSKKRFLFEAFIWSILIYAILLILPFKYIHKWLVKTSSEKKNSSVDLELKKKIAWSVSVSGHLMNWKNKCLVNAITGKLMLRIRGVHSKIIFGVKKDNNNIIRPHAWLDLNNQTLLGGKKDEYSFFSEN